MKIVTLRHSRCFENGNDDFGAEAFWAIHCAHWSSGFIVLNASISLVIGQRPMFYCPEVVARTYLHITVQSMYNVHTKKQNNNNNTSGRWSHRCGNVASLFKQIPTYIYIYTLLKIIKGTYVRNVISGLPYMLHFMNSVCQ